MKLVQDYYEFFFLFNEGKNIKIVFMVLILFSPHFTEI